MYKIHIMNFVQISRKPVPISPSNLIIARLFFYFNGIIEQAEDFHLLSLKLRIRVGQVDHTRLRKTAIRNDDVVMGLLRWWAGGAKHQRMKPIVFKHNIDKQVHDTLQFDECAFNTYSKSQADSR